MKWVGQGFFYWVLPSFRLGLAGFEQVFVDKKDRRKGAPFPRSFSLSWEFVFFLNFWGHTLMDTAHFFLLFLFDVVVVVVFIYLFLIFFSRPVLGRCFLFWPLR